LDVLFDQFLEFGPKADFHRSILTHAGRRIVLKWSDFSSRFQLCHPDCDWAIKPAEHDVVVLHWINFRVEIVQYLSDYKRL
jgi:hypothetical protein